MDVGQTDTSQETPCVLLGQLAEAIVVTLGWNVLLVLEGHECKLEQRAGLATVEAQRAGEMEFGLFTLTQLQCSHTQILKYPRPLGIHVVFGSLTETLHRSEEHTSELKSL